MSDHRIGCGIRCQQATLASWSLETAVLCHHVLAEIGVGLTGLGVVVQFLGVLFLFDRGLLAIGNVRRSVGWAGTRRTATLPVWSTLASA